MAHDFKQRGEEWRTQTLQPNNNAAPEITTKMRQEQRRQELEAAQLHAQSKQQVAYSTNPNPHPHLSP